MRDILRLIEGKTDEYRRHPMFAFLRDRSIAPASRLAFAPSAAFYVLSFTDFCTTALRREPTDDRLQTIVNQQTREEALHSRWFLEDLTTLGADAALPLTDALRFLWGDATARSRLLSATLHRLAWDATPLKRLVLVECVEATAEVMISHVMAVGDEWSKETGRPLKFFGHTHEDAEEHHSFKGEDVQTILRAIELDSGTRRDFHAAVDVVFTHYAAFTDELLEAAQKPRTLGQR